MRLIIEDIVEKINETIARQLKCKTGEDFPAAYFGLANPVQIREEDSDGSIPAIIANDGECHSVFSDDDYAFGVYHRLLSKSYDKVKGFGDGNADVETDEIVLVCWGFSDRLNMSALEFERDIIVPSVPKQAFLVSSDFDAYRIIRGEFRNINYLNRPEEFVFSVKYKVRYEFDRICYSETNCK